MCALGTECDSPWCDQVAATVPTPQLPGMLEFLCLTPVLPAQPHLLSARPSRCCWHCVHHAWLIIHVRGDNVSGIYLKPGGSDSPRAPHAPAVRERPGFVKTSSSTVQGLPQGWGQLAGVTLPVPPDNPLAFPLPPVGRMNKSFLNSLPGGL